MKPGRGLSAACLAWVAGTALQLQQVVLWPVSTYAALALLFALALWGLAQLRRDESSLALRPKPVGVMRAVCWSAMAFAWAGLQANARMHALEQRLEGRDLDVVGVVEAMPQRQDVGWRFRFRIERALWQDQPVQVPQRVYLGWYGASSRDDGQAAAVPDAVQAGERWRLRVRLKAAHGHLNPRGFDHELWLWEQGIRVTGYVRQGRSDPAPQRLAQTWQHPVEWARQRVRERMLERSSTARAGVGGLSSVGGILAALVTGDQAAIDRSDWDVFRATGVSHLMSISGVHVTLLGWLLGLAGAALWRRAALFGSAGPLRWPAPVVGAWLGLGGAAAYALFSGWGVPAQRTVCMLAVAMLLRLSARDWHWRQVWALAAAVVLAWDPWALLQPGFWLSFVAVGVLLASERGRPHPRPPDTTTVPCTASASDCTALVQPRWWGWHRAVLSRALGLLREQALIGLALMPLSLLFFGQFSIAGFLANLLAIPWVTLLVTPLALLGVLLPWAWDLAAWCLQPLSFVLAQMVSWPWASVSRPMPPWPLAVLGLAGALMLLLPGPRFWRVMGLPLLLPALLWQPARPAPGSFELLAADVGQGNAVLVRTAGHSLLYDAGPRYSPESDAGHRVLLPLLAQTGEQLDVLMLSHRDSDHTGGAPAVLSMQPGVDVWSSLESAHPLVQQSRHRTCAAGQRWVWDGVSFEVLHPLPGATSPRPNALSCVLRIEAGGRSALLAGDIEAEQERELLARGLSPVDWLLVPHHGSKTSSSEAFLAALRPGLSLVQAGYRNRFGHPAPQVMARYDALGLRWLDTAHCGALRWQSHAPQHWQCERESARRYWHHLAH
jgi:competence protein ComEC